MTPVIWIPLYAITSDVGMSIMMVFRLLPELPAGGFSMDDGHGRISCQDLVGERGE
jgi:hypothetical protein